MEKHNIVIHENTGATKESAPYLGTYISKETVREAAFADSAAQKAGLSPIQFRAIVDGSFQAIEELERSGLVRVHTDLGVVCAEISGSFPTADAAPDPEKNKLNLALRLADDIRLALADAVPAILADENLTKVRVDNVMDLATGKPYNLIHGRHRFRIAGYNMDLNDEGATVFLTDRHGVTYEVTVDEVVSKQLIIAHSTDLLEAGDYKLVVKSRAGDAEGPLQSAPRKVKYMRVEDPPPPVPTLTDVQLSATFDASEGRGKLYGKLTGANFHAKKSGETMTVMVTDTYDEYPIEDWEVNDDGTEITFERDMGNDVVGCNATFQANIGATLQKEGIVIAAHE